MTKKHEPKLEADLEQGKIHAEEAYHKVKKQAEELYKEGMHKASEFQSHVKDYSGELVDHVKQKPLTSLLIAGGIGFIIASLLKK